MKKYEVTYYSVYHVKAENKDEAIKKQIDYEHWILLKNGMSEPSFLLV